MPQSGLVPETDRYRSDSAKPEAARRSPRSTNQRAQQGGLIRGFANLDKHIENMKNFGQQVIVTFNRFASDTDEEIALVAEHCKEKGVGFAVNTVFADGGKGAVELARLVAETIEKKHI